MTAERMTAAEYNALMAGTPTGNTVGKRKNKFNARKVTIDGIPFDSDHEGKRYRQLKLLARAGQIRDLKLQVPIMLEGEEGPMLTRKGRQMRLTVDFVYFDVKRGKRVWEDAKGEPSRDYEVRRAAAQAMGYEIEEV